MLNLVLFGPPGAGKGTQSEKLLEKYGLIHLSTGDILRGEMKAETELGLKAKSLIEAGNLVPDEVVIGMIDNKISGATPMTQRSGRVLKSISERHKGKTGRVRGNLMGKRVDYSSRSVITPDARIGIQELGVPMKIAMNITFPEKVNARNIDYNFIDLTDISILNKNVKR